MRRVSTEVHRPKAASLLDVARLANVSRATAARALGNYSTVGVETRGKVLAAARALHYRTNELARSMRSGKTSTIGCVVADVGNSFFNSVIRAIIDTANAAGYQILILNTDDDLSRERTAVRVLLDKRVDGMIVVPSSRTHTDHLKAQVGVSRPVVLLDRTVDDTSFDSVTTDDHAGARAAVRHFVREGHRRIGLLVAAAAANRYSADEPPDTVATALNRMAGGRAAIQSARLRCERSWFLYTRGELAVALDAATHILTSEPRPTAMLATNEETALACISAAERLGMAIGPDLSLISFDDNPWAAAFRPALSVIQRPTYEMGKAAVDLLLRRISGPADPKAVVLPTKLLPRESVTRRVADSRKGQRDSVRTRAQ